MPADADKRSQPAVQGKTPVAGKEEVRAFLAAENPAALAAMEDLFRRLRDAGLWQTRRNSIAARLDGAA